VNGELELENEELFILPLSHPNHIFHYLSDDENVYEVFSKAFLPEHPNEIIK
jgi:hypothetical protein